MNNEICDLIRFSMTMLVMLVLAANAPAETHVYIYEPGSGRLSRIETQDKTIFYTYDLAGNLKNISEERNAPPVEVTIAVLPSDTNVIGNQFDYVVNVSNIDPVATSSLELTFDPDDSVRILGFSSANWSCNSTDSITCTLTNLPVDGDSEVIFHALPSVVGMIVSSATIKFGSPTESVSVSIPAEIIGSGIAGDTDGDGMPDSWELYYGLNPMDANDASGDLDGDNLLNVDEYMSGSDPSNPDTDGDGETDGVDLTPTFNPAWFVPIITPLLL
jgi:hypothetical protein